MLAEREIAPSSPLPLEASWAAVSSSWDPADASKYYRARYYDPRIGRFISEDPIGFLGGMNFYAYVRNNPVNRIDPSGLDAITLGGSGNFVPNVGGEVGAGLTLAFGDHSRYTPFDIGVSWNAGWGGGVSAGGAFGATYEWGNVSQDYSALNAGWGPVSCSIIGSSDKKDVEALFLGTGPGAGLYFSRGNTQTYYLFRDFFGPIVTGFQRWMGGITGAR